LDTTSDKPNESVVIAASGVLSEEELEKEDEERKAAQAGSGGEDIWEVRRSNNDVLFTEVDRTSRWTRKA